MAENEQYQRSGAAFVDPEGSEARLSAEPQSMYVDRATRCPVIHTADHEATLLKMADILYVNKHRGVLQLADLLGSNRPAIPLSLDGAEHTKYRRLLDPVFTARRIAPLAESVRVLANEMIDGFIDRGEVDAYREWCEPLPGTVFIRILGLPSDDLPNFLRFKNMVLGNEFASLPFDEALARRDEAVDWIQRYFNDNLDERLARADPGDDLLGWLLTTEVEGERLSREDLLDILGLLMIAGLDTVAASLACMLSYFARHPEQRAEVVSAPSLWPSAVEELMRFESPVTEGGRIATEDLDLPSGEHVSAGTHMSVIWAAANLDADCFTNPLTVDLRRSPNPHIGFASGFHRCLGSHLARMEMQVALEAWHRRIPDYEIAPGTTLVYTGNPRAPHHFPLVWS